jgi:hypothetical protein
MILTWRAIRIDHDDDTPRASTQKGRVEEFLHRQQAASLRWRNRRVPVTLAMLTCLEDKEA